MICVEKCFFSKKYVFATSYSSKLYILGISSWTKFEIFSENDGARFIRHNVFCSFSISTKYSELFREFSISG